MAPRLWSMGSVIVEHQLSYSAACGIFPEQRLNLGLLYWSGDFSFTTEPPVKPSSFVFEAMKVVLGFLTAWGWLPQHPNCSRVNCLCLSNHHIVHLKHIIFIKSQSRKRRQTILNICISNTKDF